MRGFSYRTNWFAERIKEHDAVRAVEPLVAGHLRIVRRKYNAVTIAPVSTERLTPEHVESILTDHPSTIICLIPKRSHYIWEARERAERLGSTVHTMKEAYTFLSEKDPRPFLNKNVAYARDRLEQHSKVQKLRMSCEASMRLVRTGGLSTITVAVEYDYEFSEESLVAAIRHHPDATAILNSNPNGRPTKAALAHAKQARIGLFSLGELMGALNYDGDKFLNYQPSDGIRR